MKKIGFNGLALIKDFEKCVLVPYKDSGGVWTDGWGNTVDVDPSCAVTKEQADKRLLKNLEWVEKVINDNLKVELTQNQFDAVCSLVFNIGASAFKDSTLLKKLNKGDKTASEEFVRWNKDNGKVVAGLTRRRLAETELFES